MKRILIILFLSVTVVAFAFSSRSGERYALPFHAVPSTVDMALHFKLFNSMMTTAVVDLNATGQVFDYSLNDIRGELFDSAATLFPRYPGFYFDGSEDRIFTNATLQTTFDGDFSITVWVKPDEGRKKTDYQVIVGAIHDTSPLEDVIHLSIQALGKVRFTYESNDNEVTSEPGAATFAAGQGDWTHLAVTADADTMITLYVDSVLKQSTDPIGVTFADFVTDCDINIGGLNSDTTHDGYHSFFGGLISDVRIYERVLSSVEVKNIYEVTRWRYDK